MKIFENYWNFCKTILKNYSVLIFQMNGKTINKKQSNKNLKELIFKLNLA